MIDPVSTVVTTIILKAVEKIWEYIEHLWRKLLNFFNDIVAFFKNPKRLEELKKDKEKIAVTIKEKMENGEFNVVNCLYDTNEEDIVDYECQTIQAEDLDNTTKHHFGDKDMIILR